MIRLRFAPSPTGYLHIGGARMALINWLFARQRGGVFVLRIDDTDTERCLPEYRSQLYEDLKWLGLEWDIQYVQSERLERYKEVAAHLKAQGFLYPCYETEEELDYMRQHTQGPWVYGREALKLSPLERQNLEAAGRQPYWRFRLNEKGCAWDDLIYDRMDPAVSLSDPVLIRQDGQPTYMFCSAVDDIDMKITHILRGGDHLSNTIMQLQIMQAMQGELPEVVFGHIPLISLPTGEKLSKRFKSINIQRLREQGIEAMAIHNYLFSIGVSQPLPDFYTLVDALSYFDIKNITRTVVQFNVESLSQCNTQLLAKWPYEEIKDRLGGLSEIAWNLIRGNIQTLHDVLVWQNILESETLTFLPASDKHILDDIQYVREAISLLPARPWEQKRETVWTEWMNQLKAHTQRQGRELVRPLRYALTGQEHGPEMRLLVPYIGEEKIRYRLHAYTQEK